MNACGRMGTLIGSNKRKRKMNFLLYGGAIMAGLVVWFGYRLVCRRGQCEPKDKVANKISDFYSIQDKDHNY